MSEQTPDSDLGSPDLAVVIPAWDEKHNLELLLPALKQVLGELNLNYDIVVVDGGRLTEPRRLP